METLNTDLFTKEYSDTDLAPIKDLKEKNDDKLLNQFNIYQKEKISELTFKNRGFISTEKWSKSINLHSRIIQITKHQVTCECVLDKENLIFETRTFSRELFEHLRNIKEKHPILISIRTKAGSSRIDIYEGKGVVNEKLFEINEGWEELANSGLDKAITFYND